ncbi:hypothetical protein CDAR_251341 [Caerostris darwini]|uniref:Uncharacterized protein n=1 Tax=Caerostris darwini TaxID=1538125 RepID=A0AAV4R9V5_9ARAC|nr:hypothetical protein CDAR_251341 [Caerostris darwini]
MNYLSERLFFSLPSAAPFTRNVFLLPSSQKWENPMSHRAIKHGANRRIVSDVVWGGLVHLHLQKRDPFVREDIFMGLGKFSVSSLEATPAR